MLDLPSRTPVCRSLSATAGGDVVAHLYRANPVRFAGVLVLGGAPRAPRSWAG